MKNPKFIPEQCDHCHQTTEYRSGMDRGSAWIVIAIAAAQRINNQKEVHLKNQMLALKEQWSSLYHMAHGGKMTATMIDNVLVPKYHGLVAQGKEPGTYLLTRKGAKFLAGEPITRYVLVDKLTHSKKAEWQPEIKVTIRELLKSDEIPWWEGELAKYQKIALQYDQTENNVQASLPGLH